MRLSDPLHLGALLFGLAAACWGLSTFVGAFFVLGMLLFIAGPIVLLFARALPARMRAFLRGGAIAALGAHALLLVFFILEQPLGFGRDPARAVHLTPPAWAQGLASSYVPAYFFLIAALTVVAFYLTWSTMERALGIGGAVVILVVVAFGGLLTNEAAPLLTSALLLLGFAGIAVAALLPAGRATYPPWSVSTRTRVAPPSAATGNP